MSPPQPLTIKLPAISNLAANSLDVPGATGIEPTIHQEPATSTKTSAELNEVGHIFLITFRFAHGFQGACATAASLKTLHAPELQNWMTSNGVCMPKSKKKDSTLYILGTRRYSQYTLFFSTHRSYCRFLGVLATHKVCHRGDHREGKFSSFIQP